MRILLSSLFVVATPIGNLSDISNRAIDVLKKVHTVASEDTRVTRKLLTYYGIKKPLVSLNAHNGDRQIPKLLRVLEEHDLAFTTDAGTPGVSDPGHKLVQAAQHSSTRIIPIPGASSITSAVSVAPFPIDSFYFAGFVPRRKKEIVKLINKVSELNVPIVFFESPHRIIKFLSTLVKIEPARKILIMREMTKIHEERFYGTAAEAAAHFQEARGEFTLVMEPFNQDSKRPNEKEISEIISSFSAKVSGTKELAGLISQSTGLSSSEAYKRILETRE